jgi:hypothetical protein
MFPATTEAVMRRIWISSVAIGACFTAQICGATQSAGTQSVPAVEESDEVIVRGTPLWELRENVIKAEDRFYSRYNELNNVDDFDVECRWDAPTGSHVMRRGCLSRLAVRVNQEYARSFLTFLSDAGPAPDMDPHIGLLDRYGEFKDNVQYLLKMNPDLRRMVQERAIAVKRYNDERRKYFKGRLVVYK